MSDLCPLGLQDQQAALAMEPLFVIVAALATRVEPTVARLQLPARSCPRRCGDLARSLVGLLYLL